VTPQTPTISWGNPADFEKNRTRFGTPSAWALLGAIEKSAVAAKREGREIFIRACLSVSTVNALPRAIAKQKVVAFCPNAPHRLKLESVVKIESGRSAGDVYI
jgi:hypothetical protein